jgi:hypothetical protein
VCEGVYWYPTKAEGKKSLSLSSPPLEQKTNEKDLFVVTTDDAEHTFLFIRRKEFGILIFICQRFLIRRHAVPIQIWEYWRLLDTNKGVVVTGSSFAHREVMIVLCQSTFLFVSLRCTQQRPQTVFAWALRCQSLLPLSFTEDLVCSRRPTAEHIGGYIYSTCVVLAKPHLL